MTDPPSTKDRHNMLLGFLYGFPVALFMAFGLFHLLNGLGLLANEVVWGVIQIATMLIMVVAFMVLVTSNGTKDVKECNHGSHPSHEPSSEDVLGR